VAASGQITQTADGFDLRGRLSLEGATATGQVFEDAGLNVTFVANGDLLSLAGKSLIPPLVTNAVDIIGRTRSGFDYINYLAAAVLYVFHMDGLGFRYLWPVLPVWNACALLPLGRLAPG